MINIKKKEECCGCHGCTNICPKQCISMEIDNEGFWYPKVDKSKCIDCSLCVKVCPIINIPRVNENKIITYACKNKINEVRESSSSGGVFTLLCEKIINNGGVVFGAAFDENFNVAHDYAENLEKCIKFRGSKYVQSRIGNMYKKAKEFLDKGRVVLFSGTPCQIAGLETYLIKKYENLIMIDIACHGVPSPKVYRKYIEKIETLNNSKIKSIQFREKSNGWKDYNFKVTFENKEFIQKRIDNIYMEGFLKDLYLRPSCYACNFKKPITSADVTLADYWGVQNIHPEFDDDKGVSLILVNTDKGRALIDNISKGMDIMETDYEFAIKNNKYIVMPVKYNKRKDKFFKNIDNNDIESSIYRFTRLSLADKAIKRFKIVAKKIIKNI